jgi:hypothetical protein
MASAAPLRGSAAVRALLFLLVCSPAILFPRAIPVAHPLVLMAIVLAISYAFLRNEGRSLSVLGLEASWRRVREAATGFLGGAALINDPPTPTTLFAPLSPRPWTSGEQFVTLLIMDGAFVLVSIALWRSYNASFRRGMAIVC